MATGKTTSPAAASLGDVPPTRQRGSLSQQAAEGANDVIGAALAGMGFNGKRAADEKPFDDGVMNPNGQTVHLSQFLDHEYIAEDHTSIFAKDPAEYLREPDPDCMYVWPAKGDPHLFARIRSGTYRPVSTSELRDDCALPVTTHTVPGIVNEDGTPTKLAAVYDLVLMEVGPKAVKRLYKWPAYQAALRTKQNLPFERLRQAIEQESRGRATATMERVVE